MSALPAGIETKKATSWNQPRSRGFEYRPTFTEPTIDRPSGVQDISVSDCRSVPDRSALRAKGRCVTTRRGVVTRVTGSGACHDDRVVSGTWTPVRMTQQHAPPWAAA